MKQFHKRIISAVLAIVLFMSNFPVLTHADGGFSILCEGNPVTQVEFYEHERLMVSAENYPAGTCQWQINIPGTNQWVNILGQTGQTLNLTYALLGSLMDGSRSASVRCAVMNGSELIDWSTPLRATVLETPEKVPSVMPADIAVPETTIPFVTEPVIPEATIPEETWPFVPGETEPVIPETTAPAETEPVVPETTVPAETEPVVPETTAPAETEPVVVPETTVPAETEPVVVPETTAPAETEATLVSETTVPAETEPVLVASSASAVPEVVIFEEAQSSTEPPMALEVTPVTEPQIPEPVIVPETTVPVETEPVVVPETTAPAETEPVVVPETTGPAETEPVVVPETTAPAETEPVVVPETTAPAETEPVVVPETTTPVETQPIIWLPVQDSAALSSVQRDADMSGEYVEVTVSYWIAKTNEDGSLVIDPETGLPVKERTAFDPYVARLRKGASFSTVVVPPTILGYEPVYNGAVATDGVSLSYTALTENANKDVFYRPAPVPYSVRYFKQNIYNDLYAEDTAAFLTGTALTGTYPEDINKTFDGFTKLYNYPEVVAADGSTEFQIYYDRNYYLYNFDLGGGFGTDPVYARYETMLSIPEPKRPGWSFAGWDLVSVRDINDQTTKLEDGTKDRLHTRVQNGNYTYKALWTQDDTTFTVVYWVQDADQNADGTYHYSYAFSYENVPGKTGDVVNLTNLSNYKCENAEGNIISLPKELPNNHELRNYSDLNEAKTAKEYDAEKGGVILEGDGSSIVNIYFDRREYKLRFVYARSYARNGSTTYQIRTPSNENANPSISWTAPTGSAGLPSLELPSNLYPSNAKGSFTAIENGTTYTYYYFDLTAKYRQDFSMLWPKSYSPGESNFLNGYGSPTVYNCVGWTVDTQSGFAKNPNNPSRTISGRYDVLDEQILTSSSVIAEDVNHVLYALWDTNSYLWEYNYYVGITQEEYDRDVANGTAATKTYMTYAQLAARNQGFANFHQYWPYWRLEYVDSTYSFNNVFNNAPRTTFEGLKYSGRLNGTYTSGYQTINRVDYFYFFLEHTLTLNNHGSLKLYTPDYGNYPNGHGTYNDGGNHGDYQFNNNEPEKYIVYESGSAVDYKTPLSIYIDKHTGATWEAANYPNTLEPDAYEFAGWYTGPDGTGRRVYSTADLAQDTSRSDMTMPDEDLILFAYWKPKTYTISFYEKYGDTIVYKEVQVPHGQPMNLQDFQRPDPPFPNATFAGWFYLDKFGEKQAFDPETMIVGEKMDLFAEWRSSDTADYTVYYEDQGGTTLSEPTASKAYIGSTKTFFAKAISQTLGSKTYFPTVSSHSIVVQAPTAENPDPNVHTFKYIACEKVYYKVRFYDDTNKRYFTKAQVPNGSSFNWGTDEVSAYALFETKNAVEDIHATYIADYLADAGFKRLHLSAEQTPDEVKNNVVTFVYTKDEVHANYVVRHEIESLAGGDYEEYATFNGFGDITNPSKPADAAKRITEEAMTINGFTCGDITVEYLDGATLDNSYYTVNGSSVTSYLPAKGLKITFRYNRNQYWYQIDRKEYGVPDDQDALQDPKYTVWKHGKFGDTIVPYELDKRTDGTNPEFDSITLKQQTEDEFFDVTYELKEFTGEDNQKTKTMTVRKTDYLYNPATDDSRSEPTITSGMGDPQVFTFYYEAPSYDIAYFAITKDTIGIGGTVSPAVETVKTKPVGAEATAEPGFYLAGWFEDSLCNNPVENTWVKGTKITPDVSDKEDKEYYALFRPITLTIHMNECVGKGVYHVMAGEKVLNTVILGADETAVIERIPVGTYVVPDASWDWNHQSYMPSPAYDEHGNMTVHIDRVVGESCWLHDG